VKLLFATVATSVSARRFERSRKLQEKIPEGLSGWDRLLVTDQKGLANEPRGYEILKEDLWTNGKFNYSRYRNASMRYAAERGYDWMIQGNADLVMLRPPESFPDGGLSSIPAQDCTASEVEAQILKYQSGSEDFRWGTTSCFLMGKKVFGLFSFCERFYGYGYEDADFMNNVIWPEPYRLIRAEGLPLGARSFNILGDDQIWGQTMKIDMERNRSLFEERAALVAAGGRVE
jgi:hypothetical protein